MPYTYPTSYKPKPIEEQKAILEGFFQEKPEQKNDLPKGMEAVFVIPRWQSVAKTYNEAVEKVLSIIASQRPFFNYCSDLVRRIDMPQLSKCCDAPLDVVSADEGTSYYRCTGCAKATDPVDESVGMSHVPEMEKREWWEKYTQLMYFADGTWEKNIASVNVPMLLAEQRRRTIIECRELVEQSFKHGHGGGNYRRLVTQLLAKLEEYELHPRHG